MKFCVSETFFNSALRHVSTDDNKASAVLMNSMVSIRINQKSQNFQSCLMTFDVVNHLQIGELNINACRSQIGQCGGEKNLFLKHLMNNE